MELESDIVVLDNLHTQVISNIQSDNVGLNGPSPQEGQLINIFTTYASPYGNDNDALGLRVVYPDFAPVGVHHHAQQQFERLQAQALGT